MPAKPEATTTLGLERFAPEAKALVAGAQALADERKHAEVQPLHFLARGLERDTAVLEVFRRAASNSVELVAAVERSLAALPKSNEPAYLAPSMLDLLERAEREAERERSRTVQLEHLLNALSQEIRGPAGELLGAFGVAPGSLRAHTAVLRETPRTAGRPGNAASPVEQYTRDLVDDARRGKIDAVIGRDAEVRRVLTILERRHKSHPLLVGEPGVG
jgi:ATP-dependent Clp protease ATP-binding subunit ClpB